MILKHIENCESGLRESKITSSQEIVELNNYEKAIKAIEEL